MMPRSFIVNALGTEFSDGGERWRVGIRADGRLVVDSDSSVGYVDLQNGPIVPPGSVVFAHFEPGRLEVTWLVDGRPAGVRRFLTADGGSWERTGPRPVLDVNYQPEPEPIEWISNLPTVRQLVAHLLLPWLLVWLATLLAAAGSAVLAAALFGHDGPWLHVALGLTAGSLVAWITAATSWPVWLSTLRSDEQLLVGNQERGESHHGGNGTD